MAATLGVGTFHYAPYALFSFMSPLVVIALAFLNIRMPRRPASAAQR
jgi:NhaC family Na+:H+ antiporter